jgi:hypothetical protein
MSVCEVCRVSTRRGGALVGHVDDEPSEATSAGDADWRQGQHAQEVSRELPARVPILEADHSTGCEIDLLQPELDLFSNHLDRLVAFKAKPGNIGVRVVVAFDSDSSG